MVAAGECAEHLELAAADAARFEFPIEVGERERPDAGDAPDHVDGAEVEVGVVGGPSEAYAIDVVGLGCLGGHVASLTAEDEQFHRYFTSEAIWWTDARPPTRRPSPA